MLTRQSLMSRIVTKDVFTPFEAILIQYLNMKQIAQQKLEIWIDTNPYKAAESIKSLYTGQDLKQILSFNTLQEAQEYDAYKWAADLLMRYDKDSMELAYKAIALKSEMRYFRDENLIQIIINKNQTVIKSIENFTEFSELHQKSMTFLELVHSFIFTLKILMMTIDNVLSLNHFLNGMVEVTDLLCLNNLKKILLFHEADVDNDEQIIIPFGMKGFDYWKLLDVVIEDNHKVFIQFITEKLALFGWRMSPNFEKDSREFVIKTVKEVIG